MARRAFRTSSDQSAVSPGGIAFDLAGRRALMSPSSSGRSARAVGDESGRERARGFTIVELLIVIVVIGILAAIVIVSYTGITQQAKISSAKANAEQVAKKLATFKIQNADSYPTTEAAAEAQTGIDLARYVYSVNSATGAKNYCATYTKVGLSYSVSSTSSTPIEGECVTNLAENPSFESSTSGWGSFFAAGGWAGTTSHNEIGAAEGRYYRRITLTATGSGSINIGHVSQFGAPKAAGDAFSEGAWVRSSGSSLVNSVLFAWRTSPTSYLANPPAPGAFPSGNWQYLTIANATNSDPSVTFAGPQIHLGSSSDLGVGDTFDIDGIMFTKTPVAYPYRDGNSPGWFWNGEPNNSTSTGPALAL